MDSDSTLLSKILSEIEAGQTLESVVDNLDEKAKSKLIELVDLEQTLAKLQPAEEDLSPESLELMRRLRSSLGSQPATSKEDAFSPGNSFGAYQIVRELGRGGMGTVYEAVQIHLGKRVAVKVIAPHILSDPHAVARFRREMKAAGQVEHRNVVRAMDAGEIQGTLYLVTEFVSGIDLAKHVAKNGPFPPQQALQISLQACSALQAAHARGITHRDVKPSNLVLTTDGQIKLLDLGLARLASERQSDVTATGAIFGTPDYMAPEQWNDPKTVDGRADLYAIGCTLFFLLTAKPPYAGDQYPTTYSKMKAHMEAPIPQLPNGEGADFSQINALLQRLLAKQPEQRFANATELIIAISEMIGIEECFPSLAVDELNGNAIVEPSITPKVNPAAPTVEVTAGFGQAAQKMKTESRSWPVVGAAVLGGVLLASAASYFVSQQFPGLAILKPTDQLESVLRDQKVEKSSETLSNLAQYQLNREAAAWIISVGGRFQLLSDGRWISKLEDIPTSDFSMREVYLVNCQRVDPAGYAKLAKLDLLPGLSCWDSPTDDECLVALLSSKSIKDSIGVIQAYRCPISDAVAGRLAECKKLFSLTLSGTQITDFSFIQQLHDLEIIDVTGCRLSTSSLSAIAKKSVHLEALRIGISDFVVITESSGPIVFPVLEQIQLYENDSTRDSFSLSATCPNVRLVSIHSTEYRRIDIDWNDISKLSKLQDLQLNSFEPATLLSSQQIPQLESVQLNSFRLDLSAIESYLRCSSKLKKITMSYCAFAADFASHQKSIPELAVEVEITSSAIDSIAAAAMARLLPNSKVTLNGLVIDPPLTEGNLYQPKTTSQLHRAVARRILECGGSAIIIHKATIRQIQKVDDLPTEPFALSSFILQGAPNWTMKDHQLLERIQYSDLVSYLPELTQSLKATTGFRLSSRNFTVDSQFVQALNLEDAGIGQLGVVTIRKKDRLPESVLGLPSLQGFTGVLDDAHLAKLSPDSPLSFLELFQTPSLSVEGIRGLSKFKHLSQVFYRGELTSDMIREFAELPQLRLLVMLGSQNDIQSLATELSQTKPKLTLVHPQLRVSAEEVQAINELRQAGVNLEIADVSSVKDPAQSHFVPHLTYDASQESLVAKMLPKLRYVRTIAGSIDLPEIRQAILARGELHSLQIQASEITDEDLRQLSLMNSLETLYLSSLKSKITDDGLQAVVQNCPLETLQIPSINESMLRVIVNAPYLKFLAISVSKADYAAVAQLESVSGLRVLKLELAGGLDFQLQRSLARLKQVRVLNLTGVTGDADEWLQLLHAELPDCLITTKEAIVFPTLRDALPE